MTKRNFRFSGTESSAELIDKNRRKVIRDGIGLAGGVAFAGLLPACGRPAAGDNESTAFNESNNEADINGEAVDVNGEAVDVKFEVVRFTTQLGTAPFTQTINLSSGFGVPKGIIMFLTSDWFGGTGYNNGSFTIGYSDGTNEVCMETGHDSEVTPGQKTFSSMWNNQCCLRWPGPVSGSGATMRYRMSVDRFETNQVILRYDEMHPNNTEQQECMLLAIGGDDVESVIVGSDNLGTGTNPVQINVGHKPDLFFALSRDKAYFNSNGPGSGEGYNADDHCTGSYGVAINDGSNSQMGVSWYSLDAPRSNPAQNTTGIFNDSIVARLDHGNAENYSVSLTSFTDTGVEVTPSANTSNCLIGYMSIKFSKNVQMKIVDTTVPTSGNASVSGAGFRPGFGMWLNLNGPATYNASTDSSFSLAATYFERSTIFSGMNNGLDGITNNDVGAWSRAGSAFSMMRDGGGKSIDVEASSYTFTDDGVDFAISNWPENQILGRMLLLNVN